MLSSIVDSLSNPHTLLANFMFNFILSGLDTSFFLLNNLLHMYSNCALLRNAFQVFHETNHRNIFTWNTMIHALVDSGRMSQAEKLFDEMPVRVRDSVSWTSMISGYVQNGIYARSVQTFSLMLRESNDRGENYDPFSFTSVMKACGSLGYTRLGVQLHALVVKLGFGMQTCIQISLVGMYVKCGDIGLAKSVFFEIERPSLFCWNNMIYGYSQTYGPYKAFQIYS
ncbi:putative pentatricopeptide repeat-containing protein At1g68930 [Cicer arietinum]|uniref:putative pentatricopeptide repeat-containing protein At1g68930 n=1 Tax=Cicer arietinum TaxID=3827 RepID=UPI003CC5CF40